jgi:hypothetical protein
MDRQREARRQAVITAGLGVFLMWMSTGGRQMMIDRRDARLWLTGIAFTSFILWDDMRRYPETADYYAPGFREGTYLPQQTMFGHRTNLRKMYIEEVIRKMYGSIPGLADDLRNTLRGIINSNAIP